VISPYRLAVLTQPAHGEFLEAKQDTAFEKFLAAEKLRRAMKYAAPKSREQADADYLDARAVAEEWGVIEGGRV
jgi:hypothetical protein